MSVRLREATDRISARIQSRHANRLEDNEAGMVASEYVMGTAVAAGCVGAVYKVVTGQPFQDLVMTVLKSLFKKHFSL